MSDQDKPTISVVISTLNRAYCLGATLNSFRWQTYTGKFEIIVVNGPSIDHTDDVLRSWADIIKVAACPQANLSASRNIGIKMSCADIIAFMDDDAIPEPEWLDQIARAYRDPEVGAVGGRVFNQTGYEFQYEYCMVDRLGDPITLPRQPMPYRSFPASFTFPHLLGTNASFRRNILSGIGGFDEAFEYYLDETDVCARVVDAGYVIRQLDCAYVHHKLAPSSVRDEGRIIRNYYSVIKSRILFSNKHARDYLPITELIENQNCFIDQKRREVRHCINEGLLLERDAEAFEVAAKRATIAGRSTEGASDRTWMPIPSPAARSSPLISFPRLGAVHNRLAIVLISRDYPPDREGGIATFNRDLAEALAANGQLVHVICLSSDQNHVDFQNGAWIHRIAQGPVQQTPEVRKRGIPQHIWDWSASALAEARRISTHRRIDVVEAPLWDCQGLAFLLDGSWPLVTSLQTSLRFWLQSKPELLRNSEWMKSFGTPMINTECELMRDANAVRAISQAIKSDLQTSYGFQFADGQVLTAPLGLRDVCHDGTAAVLNAGSPITVLFVGRLEHRKGIDILLKAIPLVLATCSHVEFRVIGDDSLPGLNGLTYRQAFESSPVGRTYAAQVRFEGRLDEAKLQQAYASCDIFVAPSRYESFGLVFLEAMREAKPVIGCRIGGMPEIIEDEVSGLLMPPGDEAALANAILRLAKSAELRRSYGEAGRRSFCDQFTARAMAVKSIDLYRIAIHRPPRRRQLRICYVNGVCVKYDAISNAIVGEIAALKARGYSDVRLYTFACDYTHFPVTIVQTASEIAHDEYFKTADLVVFQFGIFSPLFEVITQVSPRARILVVFQNITPKELVGKNDEWIIDRSYEQMKLIQVADCVVCPSVVNHQTLRDAGINVPSRLLPLALRLELPPPAQKPSFTDKIIRTAFVGRLVRAKGPQDLIAALAIVLKERPDITVQLSLVGSQRFSDGKLIEMLANGANKLVEECGDRFSVDLRLDVEESAKHQILRDADLFILPTYHEGYCIPIGEALGAGCRVITYDNSNAAVIGKGLTRIVQTGNIAELAKAISTELTTVTSNAWRSREYNTYRAAADSYVGSLSGASVDKSFVDLVEELTLPVQAREEFECPAP